MINSCYIKSEVYIKSLKFRFLSTSQKLRNTCSESRETKKRKLIVKRKKKEN